MTNAIAILPTANEEWGFWGTSVRSGYNAALCWEAASRFLAKRFSLTPELARNLLDHRFGRHLADDLSLMENGPASAQAFEAHLAARFAKPGWRNWALKALAEVKRW